MRRCLVGRHRVSSVRPIPPRRGRRGCNEPVRRRQKAFTDDDIAGAQSYAVQASKSLRLAVRTAQLVSSHQNLKAVLESRTIIDPAAGILIERQRCGQDTVLQILRDESNNRNRKLREIPADYVATAANNLTIRTHFDR